MYRNLSIDIKIPNYLTVFANCETTHWLMQIANQLSVNQITDVHESLLHFCKIKLLLKIACSNNKSSQLVTGILHQWLRGQKTNFALSPIVISPPKLNCIVQLFPGYFGFALF